MTAVRLASLVLVSLVLSTAAALADGHKVEICHRTGSVKNPYVSILVGAESVQAHLDHGDRLGPCDCGALPDDVLFCGGIAGIPCPAGATCIDDPRDSCDPAMGGADCGGICVFPMTDPTPEVCPPGFVVVDDETDDCNPDCGDLDCRLICVATNEMICEGFGGFRCDDPAYPDCGELLDGCDTDCGGADCAGWCVDLTLHPPVPCDEDDCCPA